MCERGRVRVLILGGFLWFDLFGLHVLMCERGHVRLDSLLVVWSGLICGLYVPVCKRGHLRLDSFWGVCCGLICVVYMLLRVRWAMSRHNTHFWGCSVMVSWWSRVNDEVGAGRPYSASPGLAPARLMVQGKYNYHRACRAIRCVGLAGPGRCLSTYMYRACYIYVPALLYIYVPGLLHICTTLIINDITTVLLMYLGETLVELLERNNSCSDAPLFGILKF